ncbi:hypothetical protein [Radiobacillus sp. PE A8.2]|uniref:hypothetical protein n=1 Tax=Radiobacillus sp. PE A8.2 TaxID=3380349 RepID=UPI00388EC97E
MNKIILLLTRCQLYVEDEVKSWLVQLYSCWVFNPTAFLWMIWKADVQSKFEWITLNFAGAMIIAWLFLSGNWARVSYYLRFIIVFALLVVIVSSWRKKRKRDFEVSSKLKHILEVGINVCLLIVFGLYNIFAISGFTNQSSLLFHYKTASIMFLIVERTRYTEVVISGTAIGRVGNSGNTTEPHLHMHAEKDGVGIPILCEERFLKRNNIV